MVYLYGIILGESIGDGATLKRDNDNYQHLWGSKLNTYTATPIQPHRCRKLQGCAVSNQQRVSLFGNTLGLSGCDGDTATVMTTEDTLLNHTLPGQTTNTVGIWQAASSAGKFMPNLVSTIPMHIALLELAWQQVCEFVDNGKYPSHVFRKCRSCAICSTVILHDRSSVC